MVSRDHDRVIRLRPRQYIHVLDNNTGVTRLEQGPQFFMLGDHEAMVGDREDAIVIPPRHYAIIANPVVFDDRGEPSLDTYGQVRLRVGDYEVRFSKEPFPLYPGEVLHEPVQPLRVIGADVALRLRAVRDLPEDAEGGAARVAGEEWLLEGPGTYVPRIEVEVVEEVTTIVIKGRQALRLRARRALVDAEGVARRAGEEWLVRREGAYLPQIDEEVVGLVDAVVLTDKCALQIEALQTFVDVYGVERRAGEAWLVSLEHADLHILDVNERLIGLREVTTLDELQFCVVRDPVSAEGKLQLGKREVRKGRASFFLHPGESLEDGIASIYVLAEDEALLLQAREAFVDDTGASRRPGDVWMISGPAQYTPTTEVDVVERRVAIALDKNDGIYVRNTQTGQIRLQRGPCVYMLTSVEELWEKELPALVERLLTQDPILDRFSGSKADPEAAPIERDKSHAVVFRVPQGAASKIYDFREGEARVVFGPDLVMLEPEEMFTVLSISGGRPKRPSQHRSLALLLGPDFMVDHVTVETSDHAQLRLKLAYVWRFDVDGTEGIGTRLFSVPDYVGHACNTIASKIRGVVAGVKFDEFHRHQARIIREAVFGDDVGEGELRFEANNLVVTHIDIQSVEPIDEDTRMSLQRSVQIAIKISTDAQEAAARHDAERIEQEARARLERQGLIDQRGSEADRLELLRVQAEASAVEAIGHAAAEARARADAERINARSAIEVARLKSEAAGVEASAELEQLRQRGALELEHKRALAELEIEKAEALATQQSEAFRLRIEAIGPETLKAIAMAGPELQAKLIGGLGLKSVLITDGHSPVNLFSAANGLIDTSGLGS